MNHDYAHCLDFTKSCPVSCFRAQLCRDLKINPSMAGVPVSYMHLGDTDECPKKGKREKPVRSLTDDCWKAIEYLDNQRKKLERKRKWTDADTILYEDLGAYCSAINAALEEIDFYKERDVILVDRYGQDAIESAGMSWYHLKVAKTNEILGFTQEDIDKWNKGETQDEV